MELEVIKDQVAIGDKLYDFEFNSFAVAKLRELVAVTPEKFVSSLQEMEILDLVAVIIYAGIVGAEKAKGNFFNNTGLELVTRQLAEPNSERFNAMWTVAKKAITINN